MRINKESAEELSTQVKAALYDVGMKMPVELRGKTLRGVQLRPNESIYYTVEDGEIRIPNAVTDKK